jgi:hypothetical protein
MRLSITEALQVTAMPPALASPSRASTDATPEPKTSSGQASRPSPGSPTESAERMGLAIGGTTAQALREQPASLAANMIHWTPWLPAYTTDYHRWTGYWLNKSLA